MNGGLSQMLQNALYQTLTPEFRAKERDRALTRSQILVMNSILKTGIPIPSMF